MSTFQRVVRNIATNWVALAINVLVSFFLAPYVVNTLGSTYYGIWTVTLQFTGYLYLMDFGVRDAVVRYVAKYHALRATRKLNEMVRVALEAYFPMFLGAMALSLVGAWLTPAYLNIDEVSDAEIAIVFLLTGVSIAQGFLFNVFVGVLHGIQRFETSNYINIATGLLRAVLIVVALELGYRIVGLSVIQLAISLLSSSLHLIAARMATRSEGTPLQWVALRRRRRRALFRRILGYSGYVFIYNIGSKTISSAGPLVIAFYLPVAAVTPFAIASSLVGYARSLVQVMSRVFNPLVSNYAALKDKEGLSNVVYGGVKLSLIISLPILVTLALAGDVFIGLWMGESFVGDAAPVLLLLAIMELASTPHHVMGAALYGTSKHKEFAILRSLEGALNVGMSIWLVQIYGIVGVAIGALIPHVLVVTVCIPALLRRHVQLSLRSLAAVSIRPALAALPFALLISVTFMRLTPNNLLEFFACIALVTVVSYVPAVYLIAMDRSEREYLWRKTRVRFPSFPTLGK